MQRLAMEQVQEERARGEKILAETVAKVKEECAKELKNAVADAREEEQDIANDKIYDLKRYMYIYLCVALQLRS